MDILLKNVNEKILVCLSGGADSVALLRKLAELRDKSQIFAVHVNHNLRGDATEDEKFCVKLCRKLKVPLRVFSVDVKFFSEAQKMSTETAARVLRLKCFDEARLYFCADKIATAHNLNDRAETVVLHMLRGAGLRGLSPMSDKNGIIIRPLLDVPRCEIENYLLNIGQNWREDYTNALDIYTRNKVRHKILPALIEVNPNTVKNLAKTAQILAEENDFLEKLTANSFEEIYQNGIDCEKLLKLHHALQKRVVIYYFEKISCEKTDFYFIHAEQTVQLAKKNKGELSLPHGFRAVKEYNLLKICRASADISFEYKLFEEEELYVKERGLYVTLTKKNTGGAVFALNSKYISADFVLRTRKDGDKIFLEKVGQKKLKDFFIDRKVPKNERNRLLLLVNGTIVWIEASSVCNSYKDHRFSGGNPLYLLLR